MSKCEECGRDNCVEDRCIINGLVRENNRLRALWSTRLKALWSTTGGAASDLALRADQADQIITIQTEALEKLSEIYGFDLYLWVGREIEAIMSDLVRVPEYVKVEKSSETINGEDYYSLAWNYIGMVALTKGEAQTVIDLLVDIDQKDAELQSLKQQLAEAEKKRAVADSQAVGFAETLVSVLEKLGVLDPEDDEITDSKTIKAAYKWLDQSPPEPAGMGRENPEAEPASNSSEDTAIAPQTENPSADLGAGSPQTTTDTGNTEAEDIFPGTLDALSNLSIKGDDS